MKKYVKLLRYEFKSLVREKMTMVMLVYPIMLMLVGSFILPLIIDQFSDGGPGERLAGLIMIVVFASIAPFIGAAMLGFGLLDNRDDNTLDTIRVTPISLRGYITFKSIYAYLLSINGTFWIIYGTKLLSGDGYTFMGENLFDYFTLSSVIVYALVAGLFTPVFALFLASVAKNKIEGFAYMKASGMVIMLPVLSVIEPLQDWKQYFLGIVPIFWPVKGLLVDTGILDHEHNLPVYGYMLVGTALMLGMSLVAYRVFQRNIQS